MRRYNFRKPKKEVNTSEQVRSTSIFDFEEDKQRDNLQQHQEAPSQQDEPTHEQTSEKSTFQTRSAAKEEINKQWLQIYEGKRCKLTKMMRLGTFLLIHSIIIIAI